jgi:hypothetical protein
MSQLQQSMADIQKSNLCKNGDLKAAKSGIEF